MNFSLGKLMLTETCLDTHTYFKMNQFPVCTDANASAMPPFSIYLWGCGFLCRNLLTALRYVSSAFPFMTCLSIFLFVPFLPVFS